MVVGEVQILGQMKDAWARAAEAGAVGPELQRSLARAVRVAKRVRTETEIARGAVSISSVAVQLALKLLGDLAGKAVLLLGAGEMAQLAARGLKSEGAREILVANRSAQAADELAREVDGVPVSMAEMPTLLERADVAICSTGATHAVVTREMMKRALKARRYRPIFLVDLTLPRNVEPSTNELENVYVFDLDDLERVAAQNRDLRGAHIEKAEAIVEEELRAFFAQLRERGSVLARLRAHAEALAKAEAERTLAALQGLDEKQQKSVRALASAVVNKLLHGPTARLRAEAGQGPLGEAAAALFGLEEHSAKDVAFALPEGFVLSAFIARDDPRDALIAPRAKSFEKLPRGARVGTSSLRRSVQLLAARPDLVIVPVRGNVPTRVGRATKGDEPLDAVVLALAGMRRLGLEAQATQVLPVALSLPAAGQGPLPPEPGRGPPGPPAPAPPPALPPSPPP